MRKFVLTSLTAALLTLSACTEADPNTFEAHLPKLEDAEQRDDGFKQIQRIVKSIAANDDAARKKEFGEKVTPAFAKHWDDAKEQRVVMLEMLRDIAVPTDAAIEIWSKAVLLDGTTETRQGALLALQGIRSANATEASGAVGRAFDQVIDNPANDAADEETTGEVRKEYAKTLGELRDEGAIPVLIKSLQQTKEKQPVFVHKQVVEALATIGKADPNVIDELLMVQFRVPDVPSTQNIGERAKRALAAIGEPAVPRVIGMLKGEVDALNKLVAEHLEGNVLITHQSAVSILAAIGSNKATADLVAFMPTEDCKEEVEEPKKKKKKKKKEEEDPEEMDAARVGLRAFVANALGMIGDPAAVDALCGCRNATHNQGDLWEITSALGRIGGPEAFQCLTDIVTNGEYNPETVVNSDFVYEIRWEGARLMILAAGPGDVAKAREVIAGQTDAKVKENIGKWEAGLAAMEKCKDDAACWMDTISDPGAEWFAREKAAVELVRLKKGDEAAALAIAKAFKVRDPDARVTMALMTARAMDDKPCYPCADALQSVMDSEQGSVKPEMQLAWLTARQSMAKLRRGPPPSAGGSDEAEADAKE